MKTIGIISSLTLEHWDYNTPWVTGIGGSEGAQIEWGLELAKLDYEVVQGAPLPDGRDDEVHKGVHWHNSTNGDVQEFVMSLPLVVVFRNPTFFDAPKPAGAKWWFVAQDVDYPGFWTPERLAKVDRYITLCKAHAGYTLQKYPELKDRIRISTNGIRAEYIREMDADCTRVRKPRGLFYASSPDRGLKTLLELWPRVLERYPDTTLRVAYGFENMRVLENFAKGSSWHTPYREDLERLLGQRGVEFIGRQPQHKVYEEWFQAGAFPYPNCFKETSCISIMDAMACGAVPVVNDLWAVGEHAKALQPVPYVVDSETQDSALGRTLWLQLLFQYLEKPTSEAERRSMMQDARDTYAWSRVMREQIAPWIEEDLA